MIYGVFSDIHSNLHALKAVLGHFDRQGITHYICCGDLVGYGPKPEECVQLVSRLKNLVCVMGNHDAAVLGQIPLSEFTSYAYLTIEQTRNILSMESKNFMLSLPQVVREKKFTLVHGSPRDHLSEYLTTGEQFLESLNLFDNPLCFVGHTHIPMVFKRKGIHFPESKIICGQEKITLEDSTRYILNPGSVGQPRDANPKASFGIYDCNRNTFEIMRLSYPYEKTQKEMRDKKIASYLIERLSKGL